MRNLPHKSSFRLNSPLLSSKKGSVYDSIAVPAYILVVGLTMIIAYYIWIQFFTNFQIISDSVVLPSGETLTDIGTQITQTFQLLDVMFPLLVGGLLFVSLIFAFKTGASVIYAYVSVFMWILAVILAVVFQNVFVAFTDSFPDVGFAWPILSFILNNIVIVALVFAALITIVMFQRDKKEGEFVSASEAAFGR